MSIFHRNTGSAKAAKTTIVSMNRNNEVGNSERMAMIDLATRSGRGDSIARLSLEYMFAMEEFGVPLQGNLVANDDLSVISRRVGITVLTNSVEINQ